MSSKSLTRGAGLHRMRTVEKADIATLEPLLCSIKAGVSILGRSEGFIIDAIARGKLRAVQSAPSLVGDHANRQLIRSQRGCHGRAPGNRWQDPVWPH